MYSRFKDAFLLFGVFFVGGLSFSEGADKVNFGKQIWPIIERSCLKCHRAPYKKPNGKIAKPKGELRLDSIELLKKGGENGVIIVPGEPAKSKLLTLTTLPEDHDDIMPAKGDPLTKAETELIKEWIQQGCDFGDFKPPVK